MTDSSRAEIYTVGTSEVSYDTREACFLLWGELMCIEIAHDCHANSRSVIPESVRCYGIESTLSSLVNRPISTDDIVVSDITPPTYDAVIVVNPPEDISIRQRAIIVFSGVMDDDRAHIFGFANIP